MTRFFASRGVSTQGFHALRPAPAGRGRRSRSAWVPVVTCLAAIPAAAIDFAFIDEDPEGAGFLDPIFGSERCQALSAVADVWGRLIMASHAGETIIVKASFADFAAGSNTLASAAPHYFHGEFTTSAPRFADTHHPKALANHRHGGDLVRRATTSRCT